MAFPWMRDFPLQFSLAILLLLMGIRIPEVISMESIDEPGIPKPLEISSPSVTTEKSSNPTPIPLQSAPAPPKSTENPSKRNFLDVPHSPKPPTTSRADHYIQANIQYINDFFSELQRNKLEVTFVSISKAQSLMREVQTGISQLLTEKCFRTRSALRNDDNGNDSSCGVSIKSVEDQIGEYEKILLDSKAYSAAAEEIEKNCKQELLRLHGNFSNLLRDNSGKSPDLNGDARHTNQKEGTTTETTATPSILTTTPAAAVKSTEPKTTTTTTTTTITTTTAKPKTTTKPK